MKCLYCGNKLSLIRKLKDSEFCKEEHRRLYLQEQDQMAVARLTGAQLWAKGEKADREEAAKARDSHKSLEASGGLKGFLPLVPDLALRKGFLRLRPESLPQLPDVWLPEHSLAWCRKEWTAPSVDPPRPEHTAGGAIAPGTELTWQPWTAAPQFPVLQRTADAGLVGLGTGSEVSAWLCAGAPAMRNGMEPPLPWLGAAISPIASVSLPILELSTAAAASWELALSLLPLSSALAGATAEFEPVPSAQPVPPRSGLGLAGVLEADEPDTTEAPAAPIEPALPAAPVSDEPPPFLYVYPLASPSAQSQTRRMRKQRIREIFFSTPRLRDLPALASRVARSKRNGLLAGLEARSWNPGLGNVHNPQAAPWKSGIHNSPFGALEATVALRPPRFRFLSGELQPAPGVESCAEVVAPLRVPSARSMERVVPCCQAWNTDVQEPALSVPISELVLVGAGLEQSAGISAACQIPMIRSFPPAPELSSRPSAPQGPRWTPSPIGSTIGRSDSLLPVRPAATSGEGGFVRTAQEHIAAAEHAMPECPSFGTVAGGEPPLVSEMWPLLPAPAVPYPEDTLAVMQFDAAWPEGTAQLPRLACDLELDQTFRERLRGKRGIRQPVNRNWMPSAAVFSRLSMPAKPDLKWLIMLVPVALVLAVYSLTGDGPGDQGRTARTGSPSIPAPTAGGSAAPAPAPAVAKVPAQAVAPRPATAPLAEAGNASAEAVSVVPAVATSEPGFAAGVRQTIMHRAAISFSDDFRSGLADWQGAENWSTKWSYDDAGFVTPGPLALYTPSLSLTNYRVEFLGQIERKSLGWVYRAQDLKNYYVTKIVLAHAGPLPTAVIERYVVINGKEGRHVRRPLPLQVRNDMLYRVRLDVRDEDFTLTVQGQLVDHWSDNSLKHGGIGFFSAKGELARLRWVEVSHQYDFLGRLCALLVPYQIPAKDGSAK